VRGVVAVVALAPDVLAGGGVEAGDDLLALLLGLREHAGTDHGHGREATGQRGLPQLPGALLGPFLEQAGLPRDTVQARPAPPWPVLGPRARPGTGREECQRGASKPASSTARDAYGNPVTGYTGKVHLTSTDPQAQLPADYTFTATDAGAHTFSLTLKTAGSQGLSATDGTLRASATVNVAPAAAAQLAVTTQPPADVAAGAGFGLAVTAEDGYGNVVATFTGSVAVALSSNPGGSTLGGTLSVNAVNGVATFSGLKLDKAGTGYALQATSTGLTPATTSTFDVTSLTLSGTSVYEFRPVGTVVGILTTDEPGSHTFTYTLVPGTGSTDNASFTISGNQLLTADAFDLAARSSYSIRVRSTDEANNTLEQAFTISVLDDPALTRSGRTLTVSGTAGNDAFAFTPGAVRDSLALNGTALAVDTASVDTVVFQGKGGSDSATLAGRSGGGNTLLLSPGGSSLSGPGYTVRLQGVATVRATGGPGDSAALSDPTGNDTFVANPTSAYLSGGGFYGQAGGFSTVVAVSSGTAYLYDSAGNDVFVGTPSYAYLTGPSFFNETAGFKTVLAYSTAGGSDIAELADSGPGGSAFVAAPTYAYLAGGGSLQEASDFHTVIGVAVPGDTATLYDSPGNDTFVVLPGVAYLAGSGFMNQANSFKTAVAVSQGGQDTATLYGATSGGDTLVSTPSYAYLSGAGFLSQVSGFKTVVAVSQGSKDAAYLYGSGGSDTFVATAAYAFLRGTGYYTQVSGFHAVSAYG
jgi:hypothetical protein